MPETPAPEMPDADKMAMAGGVPLLSPLTRINLILICILLLIFCGVMLTEFLTNIILMLAASLILTYILLGPVNQIEMALERLRESRPRWFSWLPIRTVAILVVYALFFVLFAISVIRIAPPLAQQIRGFAKDIPTHLSRFAEIQGQASRPPRITEGLKPPATQSFHESKRKTADKEARSTATSTPVEDVHLFSDSYAMALERLAGHYQQYVSRIGAMLLDLGASALSALIYILTTLVLVFYLLHDGREVRQNVVEMLPSRHRETIDRFLDRLHLQFHSITQGQIMMSFLGGGVIYLLLLMLGAPYSLLLGVFFGLASILPVIGPWIGLIPIVAFIAFSRHPGDILHVLLAAGVFYLVKTYWIWPKLIQRKYDVHPLLFILTFVACLKLLGPLGILLSFPLAGLLGTFAYVIRHSHHSRPPRQV